ncbi:MAG: hypothetical protein ACXIUW_07500 [Roseinatronobacter sp.]
MFVAGGVSPGAAMREFSVPKKVTWEMAGVLPRPTCMPASAEDKVPDKIRVCVSKFISVVHAQLGPALTEAAITSGESSCSLNAQSKDVMLLPLLMLLKLNNAPDKPLNALLIPSTVIRFPDTLNLINAEASISDEMRSVQASKPPAPQSLPEITLLYVVADADSPVTTMAAAHATNFT